MTTTEVVPHCIWDTKTDRRAGMSSYLTRKQAESAITYFKERQSRGGRPDIDPSGYVPRIEDETTR